MADEREKNMNMTTYTSLPATDFCGNAGNYSPGEKEQRYRPFMEKLHEMQKTSEE